MSGLILNTKKLFTSKWLNLNETEYIPGPGKEPCKWLWAEREGAKNAVVIGALTRDKKLVVIKEFRVPIGGCEWGFPAGLLEPGEAPINCAERELKEETGFELERIIRKPSRLVYNTAGLTNEGCYMIYCIVEGSASKDGQEASENIEIYTMNRQEVQELLNDETKMLGAKASIVMQRFVDHGDI